MTCAHTVETDFTVALTAGLAYYVFVFFKAFQQRNVAHMHYRLVMPVSYAMSITEVIVVSFIALGAINAEHWTDMVPMVLGIGTGGGAGALTAMWVHKRYVK